MRATLNAPRYVAAMSKRLLFLESMIAGGKADAFARYAYALELKSLGRLQDSLAAFGALNAFDGAYVPQYLMAGGVAEALGLRQEALDWYSRGIERAQAVGDGHALSELRAAHAQLAGATG